MQWMHIGQSKIFKWEAVNRLFNDKRHCRVTQNPRLFKPTCNLGQGSLSCLLRTVRIQAWASDNYFESRTHMPWGRSYSTGGALCPGHTCPGAGAILQGAPEMPPLHDEQVFNDMPPFYKMIITMIHKGIQRFPYNFFQALWYALKKP